MVEFTFVLVLVLAAYTVWRLTEITARVNKVLGVHRKELDNLKRAAARPALNEPQKTVRSLEKQYWRKERGPVTL